MADVFGAIAEDRRAAALAAIASVADPATVAAISPTTRGASGATTLRIDTGSDAYLLRLEVGLMRLERLGVQSARSLQALVTAITRPRDDSAK